MKVGILGSGDVAKTLAAGFLKHGHQVMVGTRSVEKLADWQASHSKASLGSFADAASFAQLVILAVKGSAALDALKAAGSENLANKPVIDTTNPISDKPPVNGVLNYYTSLDNSQMEILQKEFPTAKFVKAFNSVGSPRMVDPYYSEGKPTMFICGNDDEAKATVSDILVQFGWGVADFGKVESARAIEPLCMLWCIDGFNNNSWTHAFKLVRE